MPKVKPREGFFTKSIPKGWFILIFLTFLFVFEIQTFFQSRLVQKLGEGAKPFTLTFPQSAPNSVLIRGEEGDTSSMGVSYEVKLHIGDSGDDHVGTKKASVHMGIRKVSKDTINFNN